MLNINETRLMGRLADDPSFGTSGNGREYMRVRVLTGKSFKDDAGNWQERTVGHNVTTFDRYRIQHGRERLRKGMLVYVEGENAETKRVENGQTTYFRGVLVPIGGKLHSIERGRAGDDEGADRGGRRPQGSNTAGQSEGRTTAGNVPDGPPLNGQNPLDQHDYDDEIPF